MSIGLNYNADWHVLLWGALQKQELLASLLENIPFKAVMTAILTLPNRVQKMQQQNL